MFVRCQHQSIYVESGEEDYRWENKIKKKKKKLMRFLNILRNVDTSNWDIQRLT